MNKPFDLKLFLLRLIKNTKWIITGTLIGSILIGVLYVLVMIVSAGGPDYVATVMANENYSVDEYGNEAMYINEYTWGLYVESDVFLDAMLEKLGGRYSKEEVGEALSADVPSDTRNVEITVSTKNEAETMEILSVVPDGLTAMKDYLHELDSITITDVSENATKTYGDVRILNAFILGAVLGLFVTLVYMGFSFILDDSVYIPLLFEKEYGIDMRLGKPEAGLTLIKIGKSLPSVPALNEDSVVALEIEAGRHNGKIIDYVINEVEKQGCEVARAYLTGADEMLIKAYFAGK